MEITVGKLAGWAFGVLFILAGLGLMMESLLAGGILFLTGLFLVPNVREEINERFDIQFSRWMVVLIAVIGLGLSMAMTPVDDLETQEDNGDEPETPEQENGDSEQETTEDESEETVEETEDQSETHQLGEEFQVGEISYETSNYRTRDVIGDQFLQEEASGEFVLVDMEITNNADEPTWFTDSHMVLVDEQDREYSIDSSSVVALEDSFTFEELQPGLTESGTLLYDVPEDQEERRLEISPADIFSLDEPHYVELE